MAGQIVVTHHRWKPSERPNYCGKLEVVSVHNGKESLYLLDITGGTPQRPYRVQSAMCIPFGTRAMPRNVTGRLPIAVGLYVVDFLKTLNEPAMQAHI